jgi:hypothetical protein
MKNMILSIAAVLFSFTASADLTGKLDLSCKLKYSSPNDYKATLKGPSAKSLYTLIFLENFYGAQFKNTYLLKKESKIKLSNAKASVSELNVIEGKHLIEIKTDKAGPVTLICD